jgi:hypothetical protein
VLFKLPDAVVLLCNMDSDTRDNWAYLAWDGVQRKGEELMEQFSNRVMVSMMASRQDGLYRGTQTDSLSEWYTNSLSHVQRPVIVKCMGHRYDMLNTYFYIDPTSLSPVWRGVEYSNGFFRDLAPLAPALCLFFQLFQVRWCC